jgi:hypothetical protein
MKKIFLTRALAVGLMATGQVKIGDNPTNINASSLLELESSTQGVVFPRIALTSTTAFAPLAGHVQGMTVYNTATAGDVTPGMYTDNGTAWVKLGAATTAFSVVENTSTTYAILGTEDIILSNASSATFTLPVTGIVGKRIVIANNTGAAGSISIAVASGGVFWNGSGFLTSIGNTNVFTYTGIKGWICEAIGLN